VVRLVSTVLLLLGCEVFTGNAFAEPCCPGGPCPAVPGSFLGPTPEAIMQGHVVSVDKGSEPAWRRSLFERGERRIYRGKELFTIGMPCGGIGAGQLYLRGDGTLARWWVFGANHSTDWRSAQSKQAKIGYNTYRPASEVGQGFALRVEAQGHEAWTVTLSEEGFDAIEFIGEYPIAEVRYKRKDKPALPVEVTAEVFTPWIPLNARDSANPATIFKFTLRNTSGKPVTASLAGWLENAVCHHTGELGLGSRRNEIMRDAGMVFLNCSAAPAAAPAEERAPIVFEDFESRTFANWKVEGKAFRNTPARIAERQHPVAVTGYNGQFLADSWPDKAQGKLTSKPFKIERRYISFLIGGGRHAGRTCMNLVVDDKVVRTAEGRDTEQMAWENWRVSDLAGKTATIEIVDTHEGGWGHVMVDQIELRDTLRDAPNAASLRQAHDFGSMGLGLLRGKTGSFACASVPADELPDAMYQAGASDSAEAAFGNKLVGSLGRTLRLEPGQAEQLIFVVVWHFPNYVNPAMTRHPHTPAAVGRMYANWYGSAAEVADYTCRNFERLDRATHLFRDTYFDTTLPYWFVQRTAMPASILASNTAQWWKNGRFYMYEGVGFCLGTCTHVYAYAHAIAWLFPGLERNMRLRQDLADEVIDPETGRINFRGRSYRGGPSLAAHGYAADGQCGVVLRVYREHLMSPDGKFLDKAWPRTRKAMDYMIRLDGEDGKEDGAIWGRQHSTWDADLYGANGYVTTLYLAALRAAEEMARIQGEQGSAERYRRIYESGRRFALEELWNGDYFVNLWPEAMKLPTPAEARKLEIPRQYGNGCLSVQLLGQNYANLLDLGYLYPREKVVKTLRSIYRYNWMPDMETAFRAGLAHGYNLAYPGDAGLLHCTWPLGPRPVNFHTAWHEHTWPWTAFEYTAAANMLYEGLTEEALAIIRGVHDRYDGAQQNPWNEIEGGDHYGRAMSSWACLLAVSGYQCDGPGGRIGFAPRFKPEDFKAFFTAAEGWGSLVQRREANLQTNRIEVQWGRLPVRTLVFEIPVGKKLSVATILVDGKKIESKARQEGVRVTLWLESPVVVETGESLEAVMACST